MANISGPNPNASINSQLTARGHVAIPGLDKLPAAEVKALKDGLGKFDEFAGEASNNPVFGAIANSEAMKFLRDLARTFSTGAAGESAPANAERVFNGMCGGGGDSCPPPPEPTPPPVVAQPEPTPPPVVAQPEPTPPPVVAQPEPTPPPVVESPPVVTTPPVSVPETPPAVTVAPPVKAKPDPVVSPTPVALGAGAALGGAVLPSSRVDLGKLADRLVQLQVIDSAQAAELKDGKATSADISALAAAIRDLKGDTPDAIKLLLDLGSAQQMVNEQQLSQFAAVAAGSGAPGTGDLNNLTRAFADRFADVHSGNPAGAVQALAALGNSLGAAGFSPLQLNRNTGISAFANAELNALLGTDTRGMMFEDKVAALMVEMVKKMQQDIEKRLNNIKDKADAAQKNKNDKAGESRNIEFEMLKNDMQKLSQMQQAFSGVLNAMNETAMKAVGGIR